MSGEARTLVRHTAIYTFGSILRNLASIVMLPIYTRHLNPSDYGVIELLSTTVDLFAIVFGLRVGEAIFRYHTSYTEKKDKNEVISTALILVAGLTAAGLLLLLLFGEKISLFVFGNTAHAWEMRMYGMTLPLSALIEIAFVSLRAEQRPWPFVGLSTLRLILQLSFNIYFVVVMGLRVDGVIYSALLSGTIMVVALATETIFRNGLRFSRAKARELSVFSWPLVLSALATFFFTSSDRYFLRHFSNTWEVGIYSLGYRFGYMLLTLGWVPFAGIWDTERYNVLKGENPQTVFNAIFVAVSFMLIFGALGITVFAGDVLRIMASPHFWPAYRVVPMIVAAYVFQAWTSFTNVGLLLRGRTIHTFYSTVISFLLAVLGYVILIPRFGAVGAAIATLAGFVARFLWIYNVSQSSYDMGLKWSKVAKGFCLATAIYFLSRLAPAYLPWSFAVHAMEMFLFILLLMILPVLDRHERANLRAVIRNPRMARSLLFGETGN